MHKERLLPPIWCLVLIMLSIMVTYRTGFAATGSVQPLAAARFDTVIPVNPLEDPMRPGQSIETDSQLKNLSFVWGIDSDTALSPVNSVSTQGMTPGKILRGPLNFSNPFRSGEGTTIWFVFNVASGYLTDKQTTLRLFDMYGNEIYREDISAILTSGTVQIPISNAKLGFDLQPGPYFYFIVEETSILGKGKMLVLP